MNDKGSNLVFDNGGNTSLSIGGGILYQNLNCIDQKSIFFITNSKTFFNKSAANEFPIKKNSPNEFQKM